MSIKEKRARTIWLLCWTFLGMWNKIYPRSYLIGQRKSVIGGNALLAINESLVSDQSEGVNISFWEVVELVEK